MRFLGLLRKDLRNSWQSLGPALFLGLPLLLILSFFQASFPEESIHWLAAFWLSFFVGISSLFYRSFGLEHSAQSFLTLTAFQIPRRYILWSQCLAHMLIGFVMGAFYLFVAFLFWSPQETHLWPLLGMMGFSTLVLSPLGSLLGLMLQIEREFLFSLIFFPLATPVVLACLELSLEWKEAWLWILLSMGSLSAFLSTLFFDFFFDELT